MSSPFCDITLAVTDAVEFLSSGTGAGAMVLPGFTAPALPAGVTAVPPGSLTRIFALVAKMKLNAGYTEPIGSAMLIIGAEEDPATHLVPKMNLELVRIGGVEYVRVKFFKYTHMGVYMESRRGTGDWEFLAIDTESPYDDTRPLLVAGVPEEREYRMCYWDKGTANGEWTAVEKITVGL